MRESRAAATAERAAGAVRASPIVRRFGRQTSHPDTGTDRYRPIGCASTGVPAVIRNFLMAAVTGASLAAVLPCVRAG